MIGIIAGSVAALGAGATCFYGIPVKSGTIKSSVTGLDSKWRVRFACWRWISEIWIPRNAKWQKVAETKKQGEAEAAGIMAIVGELRGELPAATVLRLTKVIRAVPTV